MSDEFKNDENKEEDDDFGALTGGGDSGLGNLPPLSDFDSADAESSPGLPPMDSAPEASGGLPPIENISGSDSGGLPPIDDIRVDTPAERGEDLQTPGAAEPIQTPDFDTPSGNLDTPEPMSGLGFQDFAADSDFSPETPDIGPGPDSDMDTPMFDSAFGGDSGDFGSGGTPAPTQAMETPMFDAGPDTPTEAPAGDTGGFADFDTGGDMFGGGDTGGDELGTPIPDFSPDTGVPGEAAADEGGKKKKKKKAKAAGSGGGPGIVVTIIAALVMLVVGLGVGGLHLLPFPANPLQADLDSAQQESASWKSRYDKLNEDISKGPAPTIDELEKLRAQIEEANVDLNELSEQLTVARAENEEAQSTLRTVQGDIEEKNGEFVTAQERLEALQQNLAITQARHEGLIAENRRLTSQVGELEIANARSQSTRETLLHNLDLLIVQIEGGSPLAPEKYSHQKRMNTAVSLREKTLNAKWVTPELLDEYTQLYLDELAIGASREYFFAKVPVSDMLNTSRMVWAECLMNGNWSVYYRTIDGQNVGSFENISNTVTPRYEFRETLPGGLRGDIEDSIRAARVEDWEEKVEVLEQKQAVYEGSSGFQKSYNSM